MTGFSSTLANWYTGFATGMTVHPIQLWSLSISFLIVTCLYWPYRLLSWLVRYQNTLQALALFDEARVIKNWNFFSRALFQVWTKIYYDDYQRCSGDDGRWIAMHAKFICFVALILHLAYMPLQDPPPLFIQAVRILNNRCRAGKGNSQAWLSTADTPSSVFCQLTFHGWRAVPAKSL